MAFWATRASAPATGQGVGCGYDGKLYVLKGADTFWRYDPNADSWTTLTPPPNTRGNQPGMAGVSGYIYIWGGSGTNDTQIMRYNVSTDTWDTSLATMPNRQDQGGGAAIGSKLYYVCGFDQTGTETNRLYEYDIAGNSWATKTACTDTRSLCGVAADEVNNKLYMFGGRKANVGQTTSRVWTQSGDSWANGPGTGNSKDWPGTGEALGASIFGIGGFDTNTLQYIPYAWLLGTGNQASMPGNREWAATGVVNGRIYAVGGFDGTSNQSTNYEFSNITGNAYGVGASTSSGTATGSRLVNPADYIGQRQIGGTYQVGGTSAVADTNTMVRHPRGANLILGTNPVGSTYQVGGQPYVSVAGSQATTTSTAYAGSFSISGVAGLGVEVDTANAGSKTMIHIGAVVTETDTAFIRAGIVVVYVGVRADEVDAGRSDRVTVYHAAYHGAQRDNPAIDQLGNIVERGRIGWAISTDGFTWTKQSTPILDVGTPSALFDDNTGFEEGGAWDSGSLSSPSVVSDQDGTLYLYYVGRSGVDDPSSTTPYPYHFGMVGVATSTDDGVTWTRYGSNPILMHGTGGTDPDNNGIYSVNVMYDSAEANSSKRFKMWYEADAVIGGTGQGRRICYATSADGFSWTKYGSNPILTHGTAGSYDDGGTFSPMVYRNSSTSWYLYYGCTRDTTNVGIALATASSPEGAYTKSGSNPLVALPHAYHLDGGGHIVTADNRTNITSTISVGDTTVAVTSASFFTENDEILITGGTRDFYARVTGIPNSTHLDFTPSAPYSVSSGYVYDMEVTAIQPTSITVNGNDMVMYASLRGVILDYGPFGGGPITVTSPFGRAVALTSSSLTGPWAIDHTARGLMIPLGDGSTPWVGPSAIGPGSTWDSETAEGFAVALSFVPAPSPPPPPPHEFTEPRIYALPVTLS